jgi:uncharacterized LabA/DUF88 family protein
MGINNPTTVDFMKAQRAMIFIDGTNLLYRLEGARLLVPRLSSIFSGFSFVAGGRQITRIYFYTIQEHADKARERHGPTFFDGIRVVLGHGIPTKDGNIKEKAVDALLVADLVYHAASRNYDYAVLVSTDTDFVHAIRRVEDFGCRSAVLGLCSDVPERLQSHCDEFFVISAEDITNARLGTGT